MALEDMYALPVLEKHHCVAGSLDLVSADHCAIMASGGTSGQRTMTVQSLKDFLWEGRIVGDLCAAILPAEGKYGFANIVPAGGLWGGGYMLFVASMSHERLVGLNVAGRTPTEMVGLLHAVVTETSGLEGVLIMGLPTTLVEMAKVVEAEGVDLRVAAIVYGGEGLEQAQSEYLRRAFQPPAGIHSYYSSSEGNCMGFSFDADDERLLTIAYESCFLWLMDPKTHRPVLETGRPGRIVVTNLYAQHKPPNFASNDMAIWEVPGETFRLQGRVQNLVSLGTLNALRFPGPDLLECVLQRTGGHRGQIHVDGQESLRIVVDQIPFTTPSREDLLQMVFIAAPLVSRELLKARLEISVEVGEIVNTAVGKTPLVIDHREV